MAIAGKSGLVYVGDTPSKVAEIANWTLDLGVDTIDITTFDSNGWKEFLAGLKEWSGSIEGNFKFADTAGQKAFYDAIISGEAIDIELRLGATAPTFSGSCIPAGVSVESPVEDKIPVSFDYQGTGALTYTPA